MNPKDIGGAGIYHVTVTLHQVSSNFDFGGPGAGAHGGWAHLFLKYDGYKEKHRELELINPYQTYFVSAVTLALDAWGGMAASTISDAADAIWDGISLWNTITSIESALNEGILHPVTIETDITVRNIETHIDVAVGAEVNGSGVGLLQFAGGVVAAVFTEVKFEKMESIEPIARVEITKPAQGRAVYRESLDSLEVTIRIWDEEGKTNRISPYLALTGGGTEWHRRNIDVPTDRWTTQRAWAFDMNALDPDTLATGGYIYVPAFYEKKDGSGYYTCTDRNDFYLKYRMPPQKPGFIEAPAEGFAQKPVQFEATTLDPDSGAVYYRFAWGDGDTTGWLGPAGYGYGKSEHHTYISLGEYHVTAQAKDTDEMESEWSDTTTISIADLNELTVLPRLWPMSVFWGDTCKLTVGAADPSIPPHDSRFWIDWGDESAPGWTEDYYPDGERVAFYHQYDDTVGIAHIRVQAEDEEAVQSPIVTKNIMVMPRPPVIDSISADASSVKLAWQTTSGQKVLNSCTVFYSSDPSPNDSVEVPIPVNPYEPACTIWALDPDTRYWFWIEETYISDDTTVATSYAVPTYTAPSPPEVTFLAPVADTLVGTVLVEWQTTDPDPGDVLLLRIGIDYSCNGGAWTGIGADLDSVNDGSYLWDTESGSDGDYVIRIIATDPHGCADTAFSDTMTVDNPDNPVVTLYSPTATDRWSGAHDIRWGAYDADGEPLSIHILYTSDYGATWGLIAADEPNDSLYSWNTALHDDSPGFGIKVVAEDPGGLTGEHVSDIFTVDNSPPLDFWFASFVPSWDAVNLETVDLAWPAAFEPLSPPVRYYIYQGTSETGIDYGTPVLVTKATNCTITGLPPGPSFFAIAAEDSVDEPNYALNTDVHSVYFTQTSGPSDNTLGGVVSQANGVVTGTAPDFDLNGSIVVVPSDALFIANSVCTVNDTTGNLCVKTYALLWANLSSFAAQSPGDWRGIIFEDLSTDYGGGPGCKVDSCTIRHAVNGVSCYISGPLINRSNIYENSHAGVDCYESIAIITVNEIHDNAYGIYCDREAIVPPTYVDISSNDIYSNSISGTHFAGGARPFITDNMIHDNENGCSWTTGSTPTAFDHNDIFYNNVYGVINNATWVTVDARYNWWGHSSGPSGAGWGWGDAVSDSVLFSPFLTSPVNASMIDDGNLEGPTSITISPGMSPPVYGRVYEHGVTEDIGQGGGIDVEFGYGPDSTYPWQAGWVWEMATYDGDQGIYDEYVCETWVFATGVHDYCFRYTMDGEFYIYGDHDGNDTGDGGTNGYSISQAGDLTVGTGPSIILVDDDEGSSLGDVLNDALDANGLAFDLWDVDSSGPPSSTNLEEHDIVIWNTGAASSQTLTSTDESNIAYYLNQGGRLFLSSQDYLSDIGTPNVFSADYLHVADWEDGAATSAVEGVPGDPITDGMVYALAYPFTNASDNIEPDSAACSIFVDMDSGEASALRYPSAGSAYYKVVFTAFPFEAVSPASERATLMGNIVTWLSPPCIPTLFEPQDSTRITEPTVEFMWSGTSGIGGRYTLEYAPDSDFAEDVVTVTNITDSVYAVPITSPLLDTTYYWHVRAIDARGEESGYQPQPFTLISDYIPAIPSLQSPADLAETSDPTPEFTWSHAAYGSDTYALEYSPDSMFTSGVTSVAGIVGTTYTAADSLSDGEYYWHVNAVSSPGFESGFQASPFIFTVDTGPPAVPALIEPEDAAGVSDPRPQLVWSSTAGFAGAYSVQYALDSTFTAGLVTVSDVAETTYTVADSLADATYYWHVEALDAADNQSGYQAHPYSFLVDTESPAVPLLLMPSDSSIVDDCRPTFLWNSTSGGRGTYTLQYAYEDGFAYGICTVCGLPDTTFTVAYPFPHLIDTTYYWHVEAVDLSGNESGYQALPHLFTVGAAGVDRPGLAVPAAFSLSYNYPNPFRSATTVRYAIPRESHVKITIYNVLGQRVVTLVDERQGPGVKMVRWAAEPFASGIYFCHMRAGDFTQTRKMLLLK